MSLTPEQQRLRDGPEGFGRIGASFVPYLMAGDEARILSEWRRLVGAPDYEPDDLSDSWPVQFGPYIERFALDWHERRTGQALTRRGEVVTHPDLPHVSCTLDAFRETDRCAIDCKAIGAWRKIDERCQFYTPQLVVQSGCTGARRAALLVVHGGAEPQEHPVEWSADYAGQVWTRIEQFWRCVLDLTPPVALPPVAVPVPAIREADLSQNNRWCIEAAAWIEHRAGAKRFAAAEKAMKELVEPAVKRAFGAGVECTRDRAGRLSLKEMKI